METVFKEQLAEVNQALGDFLRTPHDENLQELLDALASYQDEFIRYLAMQIWEAPL